MSQLTIVKAALSLKQQETYFDVDFGVDDRKADFTKHFFKEQSCKETNGGHLYLLLLLLLPACSSFFFARHCDR
jgi:hypothetical protein